MTSLRGFRRWLPAALAAAAAILAMPACGTAAGPLPTLTLSTENTPDHVQTRMLHRFAERLQVRLDGRVAVMVKDSAVLYSDRDVVEAVAAGRVDMAAPGLWHLDRYAPDFAVFLLPMFYGRDDAVNYGLRDGPVGTNLARRLEAAVDVHVLGRWIDLGDAHVFTRGADLRTVDDLRGLRIRVAGGEGNAERIRALGAEATVIPWPDFPRALGDGRVDGTLTTAATVVSANLWRFGLDHAFLDRQYFPQYVPLVSGRLWARLPADVRQAMTEVWDGLVDEARLMAAEEQASALETLAANGVAIVRPRPADVAETRAALMAHQDAIVARLGLDAALVKTVAEALERGP
ncbi:TRAP transporter substrate-binding protein DctP [Caenispirillum bisanense]|uniref:TRAP-type C4-dicarboxylate transport system, substrate-binding protein n=1 Tax=Caenispirillum bisanense TaxID=414052 RepID=A0A286GEV1_9PROT|nr:TRAP transporter substrate-binding protein DctP [Caenispirillum bisanense]SOD94032.1 TRAP-type C4-dicarboxylate transport system, substrate-binding protein [Caenispirillum bisanense]